MPRKRNLDIASFDGKLLDGLRFCGKVYDLLEQTHNEPEGVARIRLQSTKTEKRLVEELLPLARYVQTRYREGLLIKVRWFAESQPFDAKLLCSGRRVARGLWPKEILVEITSSIRKNDHLALRALQQTGGSFGSKGTSRNKTGEIVSTPYVYNGDERQQDVAQETIARIKTKREKQYPPGTVLIVRCVADGILFESEWCDIVARVKASEQHRSFREVFLIDFVGDHSATLYGDRPH
jgi:hypothetical protein